MSIVTSNHNLLASPGCEDGSLAQTALTWSKELYSTFQPSNEQISDSILARATQLNFDKYPRRLITCKVV